MGIQGLLPLLKPISKTVHVRELKGCRVAVDAYVWLHRGAYACAAELCQGQDTTRYLNYCIEKARSLLQHGLSLYIVFDGGSLQAKRGTEESRRAKRVCSLYPLCTRKCQCNQASKLNPYICI